MIFLAVLGGAGAAAAGAGGMHTMPSMPVARPIVQPMPATHPARNETQHTEPIHTQQTRVITPLAKLQPTEPPRLPPYYPYYPYNPYYGYYAWYDQYRFINQLQPCQQQYFDEFLYPQPTLLCQPYSFESYWSNGWWP
jgi:hypothetical protein